MIIPFMPDRWAASAGRFPAMTEHVAFLMKDLVLLAVSINLLKEDLIRLAIADSYITSRSRMNPVELATSSEPLRRIA